ncbi:hypothetical protein AV530_016327 [Patagioenas fasciata monilis]|uniref:Uncharacterized protein n=1 Tax=Patagioenas fasciata monilis TaxID=372326 RepID=A0A1V4KWW6_PATFA|nr:hypothetical protein AV530_016327 [Patagioenas fasciata monilis]
MEEQHVDACCLINPGSKMKQFWCISESVMSASWAEQDPTSSPVLGDCFSGNSGESDKRGQDSGVRYSQHCIGCSPSVLQAYTADTKCSGGKSSPGCRSLLAGKRLDHCLIEGPAIESPCYLVAHGVSAKNSSKYLQLHYRRRRFPRTLEKSQSFCEYVNNLLEDRTPPLLEKEKLRHRVVQSL